MAEHSSGAFRTSIGGQALIEGILMRGPEKQAIVVRDKDGQLVEKVEELKLIKDRYPILGVPLIRGTVNFLAAMVSGVKALMYSADFYPEEEESQPSKFEQWLEKHLSSEKLEKAIVGLAVLLGVGMSIFLFLVLLGIGPNGHIGFNEPGEAFELETHCVDLTPETIEANKRFFDGNVDLVPKQAYTMGIKTIMQARKVLMVANGKGKAEIIKKAFFGPVTPEVPASILQMHPDFTLVGDEEALSLI